MPGSTRVSDWLARLSADPERVEAFEADPIAELSAHGIPKKYWPALRSGDAALIASAAAGPGTTTDNATIYWLATEVIAVIGGAASAPVGGR